MNSPKRVPEEFSERNEQICRLIERFYNHDLLLHKIQLLQQQTSFFADRSSGIIKSYEKHNYSSASAELGSQNFALDRIKEQMGDIYKSLELMPYYREIFNRLKENPTTENIKGTDLDRCLESLLVLEERKQHDQKIRNRIFMNFKSDN